jgi:prophage regulatory protein
MQKTGKSRPAIYAAMPRGQFPLSVSLGARAVGWIESEIDEWIESRIAKSRSEDYSAVAKLPQALRQRMQARKANEERN